ncbi:TetR/AcrR family transcriptional regulator [Desulfovibrio sp. JC010]|uniref:TetR/AcrR family transcriptional regulator n=1 Tax=Desulfovibrio sp. JC010 TaxID=2593641 RepID=UPI0013D47C4E|nr:TetR/AcrR family transcriptional regulator [Desulfovibrio sp. JC010]NDV27539.1 TetR/AcrR family transcriptional regulator [Desulfovibrio sp. JC010]
MSECSPKKVSPKVALIIESTLEILRDHGEQGLSMRKVAAKAGMALGNLQYYFKNKTALLIGLGDVYFGQCAEHYQQELAAQNPQGKDEIIRFLVDYGVNYGDSEIGKVIRELWGIADRNEEIKNQLHGFYQHYVKDYAEMLAPFAKDRDCAIKAASVLIMSVDGHGMISSSLPLSKQEVSGLLVRMVESCLAGKFSG